MNFHSDEWIISKVKEHYQKAETLIPMKDPVDKQTDKLLDEVTYAIMQESVKREL